MSLNYEKIRNKHRDSENFWATYADLFMMLSSVFLLLYVTASLRAGANSLQKNIQQKQVMAQNDDLKEQIRVYNTLKNDYIANKAEEEEQQVYQNLMDKLSLLKDEAKQEKENLARQAEENAQKEEALNHYQQLIRNIINANVLAKAGIKRRDETIEEKTKKVEETEQVLAAKEVELTETQDDLQEKLRVIERNENELKEKQEQIANLESDIASKKSAIEQNEAQIGEINKQLAERIGELKEARNNQQISKKKYAATLAKLKEETQEQIDQLARANEIARGQLEEKAGELEDATKKLGEVNAALEGANADREGLAKALEDAQIKAAADMAALQGKFDEDMAKKKADFDREMGKAKGDAAARAKAEEDFKKAAAAEKAGLEKKLAALGDQIKDSEGKLAKARAEGDKYKDFVDDLKKQKDDLEKDLAKSKNLLNAQKNLAKSIRDNFKQAGVDVDVDMNTGDVFLTFGDEFFDTGKANLKERMRDTLEKFMPVYAKSLFQDMAVSKKIDSVEIIGFSSPTYAGKYIDPRTLSPDDKQAVNYNLDLSFQRAKSIFQYIFDTQKMRYDYQKELLPLVKVTGRSFLAEEIKGKDMNSALTQEEFCRKFSCEKSQKVVIKFNLKN
jgi:chromosome segregation ATPase